MSRQLIQQYYEEIKRKMRYGGSRKETALRTTFQWLLEHYGSSKNLELVPELDYRTTHGTVVYPDGALCDALQERWGYWEAKDEFDNLDDEIAKKFDKGYPNNNILFEDSQTAVLFQNGMEVARIDMSNANALHSTLMQFVNFQPAEVRNFYVAIEQFKENLPQLLHDLRAEIAKQAHENPTFRQARKTFFDMCNDSINPYLVMDDIREMIIQHILTKDIFMTVFDESQYHRENNIAHELDKIVGTFFHGTIKRNILNRIDHYYKVIKAKASHVSNHHDKQKFLKALYENFYKAYNPKTADRLGIIYTPHEIVRFMIEATDHLTEKHFGKLLSDKGVQILDPATGTGTFITELIEYIPSHALEYKYGHELHANEVAILPYYVANLNIEYTFAQKMGFYKEFENICFVDTLDNMGFVYADKQYAMQIGMTIENMARIKRQNEHDISVIIGNPPYNAKQLNENANNKNREYGGVGDAKGVDDRIKETYIKASTAQKTALYDMYTRFFRWACDRLGDNGIVAFVTNRSFIDAMTYDGFRKVVTQEFDEIYVLDLGGDVRKNPKLSGPKNNVFAIQTGVAISFLVRNKTKSKASAVSRHARIWYNATPEYATADEKKAYLQDNRLQDLPFEHVQPDKHHNWINLAEHDWDDLIPVATKQTKLAKSAKEHDAIFGLYSNGVITSRDEWVYDFSHEHVETKVKFFIDFYNQEVKRLFGHVTKADIKDALNYTIKWTRAVRNDLLKDIKHKFEDESIVNAHYRPFVKKVLYFKQELNEMQNQNQQIFPHGKGENIVIAVNFRTPIFACLASKYIFDYATLVFGGGGTQCLPIYRYDKDGTRHDNITDFALQQFRERYANKKGFQNLSCLTKHDIFHYVYGVLHVPKYREKYRLNLKREFPHVPFYDDFWKWVGWGKQLMDLHVNFETVEPYPLIRQDKKGFENLSCLKPKLKADKLHGRIILDDMTTLEGVPDVAWEYKLGNRSALEWVLDRYKERKPRDPTIREKFDVYRFADYKEHVIDLLCRVCTVSVETMKIIELSKKVSI